MDGINTKAVASASLVALLSLIWTMQAAAQGQSGGARPSGATGNSASSGGLRDPAQSVDRGWPRAEETLPPSRLPQEKAFGSKGSEASAAGRDHASAADQAADCARARAAIAAAGTGGETGKGRGGAAGGEGREKAINAVCSGAGAEGSSSAGKSTEAPGRSEVTGQAQATIRADENADEGLDKAQSQMPEDKKPPDR